MTIQFATAHTLKSVAGTVVFGLVLDAASCPVSQFFWFLVREAASLLLWVAVAGGQVSQVQVLGDHVYFLGCPLHVLLSLRPVLQALGAAV